MDDWPPTGLPLSHFANDAKALDVKAFAAKHGKAFLLRHGASTSGPRGPMRTRVPGMDDGSADNTGEIIIMVHPVRRRPASEHPFFVGVGRLEGNDIAIVDDTVSKFHAYIKESPEGFSVQDARSRNGTLVEGKPVAPRGSGPPTLLKSSDTVRFGSISLTYLDANALADLARRLVNV